jgi:lipopolysaccharide exporter
MNQQPIQQAGSALIWRSIQLAGVKLVFFLRLLILARLLTPDDFGLVAIAVTSIGFFLSVTDVGMIPALVQGDEVDEKQYNAAWTVGVLRAAAIAVIVFFATGLIATVFAEPRAIPIIQALALRPLLDALNSIKVADLTRRLQFRPLATYKLAEALVATLTSILLAASWGVWALVAGVLAGSLTSLILSYILAPHRPRFTFDLESSRKLIRFGQWIFVTGIIAMIGNYVLRIVITRQLGTEGLGLFTLASQLAFLPGEIASEVVGSVAFPLFARLQKSLDEIKRAFRAILVGLAGFLFPVCIIIFALAPAFVVEILGDRWLGTESLIRVLSLATMAGIFGEACVPILLGVGRPQKIAIIELFQSSILIVSVLLFTNLFGVVGAGMAWLAAISSSQLISAWFVRQVLPAPFKGLLKPLAAITIITGLGGLIAILIDSNLPGIWGLIAGFVLAVSTMISGLWFAERHFKLGITEDLSRLLPQVFAFFHIPTPHSTPRES